MKLKINEAKVFEFEMDTSGCSYEELEGYFRLTLENMEYGFPIKIEEGIVKINIPVLKDILHENVRTSLYEYKEVTVNARLDLIANNEVYIKPWSGKIDIEIPVSVKLTESSNKVKDTKVTVVDPDIKEYVNEDKQDKKSKFLDALGSLEITKKEKVEEKKKVIKDKENRKAKRSKFFDALT